MNRLKEAVAEYLKDWAGLSECDVLCEYPSRRALPLKGPTLAVGLDGIDLSPAGISAYLGTEANGTFGELSRLYGNAAVVTIRMDLYLPGSDGAGCHRLYEEICSALTERTVSFGLMRLWCEPIAYDNAAAASRLTARAALRAAFTGRESEAVITDYNVRSKLHA